MENKMDVRKIVSEGRELVVISTTDSSRFHQMRMYVSIDEAREIAKELAIILAPPERDPSHGIEL